MTTAIAGSTLPSTVTPGRSGKDKIMMSIRNPPKLNSAYDIHQLLMMQLIIHCVVSLTCQPSLSPHAYAYQEVKKRAMSCLHAYLQVSALYLAVSEDQDWWIR
jgi:hypothetical protein